MKSHVFGNLIAIVILYIGTVDSIDAGFASVEVTASDNKIREFKMPTQMFPCDISEQDMFYLVYDKDLVEIRCGEPPVN
jgi:hypothetical protein|tara:strand:- start:1752 stop:1988 length:237 start_codon:yes stop_codon:yes gene_type:complete